MCSVLPLQALELFCCIFSIVLHITHSQFPVVPRLTDSARFSPLFLSVSLARSLSPLPPPLSLSRTNFTLLSRVVPTALGDTEAIQEAGLDPEAGAETGEIEEDTAAVAAAEAEAGVAVEAGAEGKAGQEAKVRADRGRGVGVGV